MNKTRPSQSVSSLAMVLGGITLVLASSAFSAQTDAPVGEEKFSEQPATVEEPVSVEKTTAATTTVERTEEVPKDPEPSKKTIESPDVFNPSEEISEDFAVAFPVDI